MKLWIIVLHDANGCKDVGAYFDEEKARHAASRMIGSADAPSLVGLRTIDVLDEPKWPGTH